MMTIRETVIAREESSIKIKKNRKIKKKKKYTQIKIFFNFAVETESWMIHSLTVDSIGSTVFSVGILDSILSCLSVFPS